jgi:hypothetical protein
MSLQPDTFEANDTPRCAGIVLQIKDASDDEGTLSSSSFGTKVIFAVAPEMSEELFLQEAAFLALLF